MRLFFGPMEYNKLLWIVRDMCERHGVECLLYCVMPNHYHLVIRTRHDNLSRALRDVNGKFAQWWNRRRKHVGHVFQGRFKAQVVEPGRYLLNLTRYVLLNPVRAGLVDAPVEWPWSSYHATAGRADVPPFLHVDAVLPLFGDGPSNACTDRFMAHVNGPLGKDDAEMKALDRNDVRVIGSDSYRSQFDSMARAASEEVPRRERMIGEPSLPVLLQRSIGRQPLALAVMQAHGAGHSVQALAECLGISPGMVRRMLRTTRASSLKSDAGVRGSKGRRGRVSGRGADPKPDPEATDRRPGPGATISRPDP